MAAVLRILRLVAAGMGLILALAVAAAIGVWSWLGTDHGHRFMAAELARALGQPGQPAIVTGIAGQPPFHLQLAHLELPDRQGVWLTLDDAVLDIDANALWRGTLRIERLTAASIAVLRLPVSDPNAPPSSGSFSLPNLKFGLDIAELDVKALRLAPSILGDAVTATISADASLHQGLAAAHLDLHRTDGIGGAARLALSYGPQAGVPDRLTLDLAADEPTGALLARLDPKAVRRPLHVALNGAGTLRAWQGQFVLTAGKDASAGAEIALARDDKALTIQAAGDLRAQPLLPPALAKAAGKAVPFAATLRIGNDGTLDLDRLKLHARALDIDAMGTSDKDMTKLGATVGLFARLDGLSDLAGTPLAGGIQATAHISGSAAKPVLAADIQGMGLAGYGYGIAGTALHVTAASQADGRWRLTAAGGVQGLAQGGQHVPAGLGDNLSIAIDASADPAFSHVTLTSAHLDDAGLSMAATGDMALPHLTGHVVVNAADLARFETLAGLPLRGTGEITLDAADTPGGGIGLTASGTLGDFRTGIAAADSLAGGTVRLDAKAERGADGRIAVSRFDITGNGLTLDAAGTLDAARRLAAKANLSIATLAPLSGIAGQKLAGAVSLAASVSGSLSDPAIKAEISGKALRIGATAIDRVQAVVDTPRLDAAKGTVMADISAGNLSGRLSATVARPSPDRLAISAISLDGPGSQVRGDIAIDLHRKLATGSLHGNITDIGAWTELAGVDADGRARFDVVLDSRSGQDIDLTGMLTGVEIRGGSPQSLERLRLSAHLGDLLGKPKGNLSLDMTNYRAAGATIAHAGFRADSSSAGAFDFSGDAAGRWHNPLTLAFGGSLSQSKTGTTIRLARLQAALGRMPFRLQQPLLLSQAGTVLEVQGLDLAIGTGRLTGAGRRDRGSIRLDLTGHDLPIGGVATEAGQPGIGGTMQLDAHLAGPFKALAGQITVSVPDLKLAAADHPELPPLNFKTTVNMARNVATVDGQVTTLKQETVRFHTGLPIVVAGDGSDVGIAPKTALQASVTGAGELDDLASLLPLGEDRLSGHFGVDLAITGTVGQPAATGSLKINHGSYDSTASGMTLRNLELDLEGNQAALDIRQLSATDGDKGKLTGSGRVVLDHPGGPGLDLQMTMAGFTATRLDEATITTSGKTTVTGTTLAPHIAGNLTIDKAEINIPDRLPPDIPTLTVTRVNSKAPHARPPPPPLVPPVVMTFAETIKSDGRIFVRGRGLDSEWRADVSIGGTSAQPDLTGLVTAQHGSFSVLGKVFAVQSGTIRFLGGTSIDPALDLTAQRIAADTMVQVTVSGTVDKPKLVLSSTPALPQDEILARVLFSEGVSQMSPIQALQLAQAVASLSGRGPDLLGKLRSVTGLDQLGVNSGDSGSSTLTGTTVSGGKYIAPGVFLGADRGIGSNTTRGRLEIELSPHVSLNAALGAASTSSNLGVEYHLDY